MLHVPRLVQGGDRLGAGPLGLDGVHALDARHQPARRPALGDDAPCGVEHLEDHLPTLVVLDDDVRGVPVEYRVPGCAAPLDGGAAEGAVVEDPAAALRVHARDDDARHVRGFLGGGGGVDGDDDALQVVMDLAGLAAVGFDPRGLPDGAFGGGGALLVEGSPRAGGRVALDRLPLFAGASTGGQHELTGFAAELVRGRVVALCGDGYDVPAWPVFRGEEAAGEVVFMPTGEDEDDGRAGRETRGRGVGPPVPHLLPERRGVGLLAVLHGVVDEEEVDGASGHGSTDASGEDAAVVLVELPLVLRGQVGAH